MKKLVENQTKEDEKIEINTNISNVVIFLDGARVTRTSEEVSLEKGINTLKVSGISKFMDSDSVRVKGTGKGIKATLVDVETNYVYKEVTGHEELDALYEKIKQLKKEKDSLNQQKAHTTWIYDNFKTVVGNFTTEFPKFFAAGESSMDNLKSINNYSNETILSLQSKLFELADKLEKKMRDFKYYKELKEMFEKDYERVNSIIDIMETLFEKAHSSWGKNEKQDEIIENYKHYQDKLMKIWGIK